MTKIKITIEGVLTIIIFTDMIIIISRPNQQLRAITNKLLGDD